MHLNVWLEDHPAKPIMQSDGTLAAQDVNMQLLPMTGDAVKQVVNKIGRKALGKRVYPHLMRHTSATYWSNKLPYFKFCKRFGWSMTSDMPRRYIDKEGIDDMDVAAMYHEDERARLAGEKQDLLTELAEMKARLGEEGRDHSAMKAKRCEPV